MNWYTGDTFFDTALTIAFCIVGATIIASFFMQTPYGRFGDRFPGIRLSPRLGWFLMEFPASVVFIIFFVTGPNAREVVPLVFCVIWCIHYANRGYIFPFLIRVPPGNKRSFNMLVVTIGWVVTILHGYLNGSFFSTFGEHYTINWLIDPRFIFGIIVYYSGFFLTLHSDSILRNLRPERMTGDEKRYKIPQGGGFRLVSCPQYLGELVGWTGFALAAWSLPGLFILGISAANLVPRALATHRWYHETFPDYPPERKALIPFLV